MDGGSQKTLFFIPSAKNFDSSMNFLWHLFHFKKLLKSNSMVLLLLTNSQLNQLQAFQLLHLVFQLPRILEIVIIVARIMFLFYFFPKNIS